MKAPQRISASHPALPQCLLTPLQQKLHNRVTGLLYCPAFLVSFSFKPHLPPSLAFVFLWLYWLSAYGRPSVWVWHFLVGLGIAGGWNTVGSAVLSTWWLEGATPSICSCAAAMTWAALWSHCFTFSTNRHLHIKSSVRETLRPQK